MNRVSLPRVLERDGSADVHDGVVCLAELGDLPTDDIAWVIEELFRHADHFVFACVRGFQPSKRWITPPDGAVHTADWWSELFQEAAERHPEVHWEILVTPPGEMGEVRQGGRFLGDAPPSVWVLLDEKPGHRTQSLGLAEELGWLYREVQLEFGSTAELPNVMLGTSLRGLRNAGAAKLAPPWPDLVIASGRRTSPVARWIRDRSRGRTRLVQIGRLGVAPPGDFDLTVVPAYARLLSHPKRVEVTAPLTRVRSPNLKEAEERWASTFADASHPRIALLVGGNSPNYRLTPRLAEKLGHELRAMVDSVAGSIFVTTSRRTPEDAVIALERALGEPAHFFRWTPDARAKDNPYSGYLALSDAFVVTGESASMIAEATATGKPVMIYPLPRGIEGIRGLGPNFVDRWAERVLEAADARPKSRRGITRPQRGSELFLSKLLARELLWPTCDYGALHDALVSRGIARIFDGEFVEFDPEFDSTRSDVAKRVRDLFGIT